MSGAEKKPDAVGVSVIHKSLIESKLSERTLSYADSSTYGRLDKTPFELQLIQTLYLHIPVSGQLQLRTLFLLPEGVRLLELFPHGFPE